MKIPEFIKKIIAWAIAFKDIGEAFVYLGLQIGSVLALRPWFRHFDQSSQLLVLMTAFLIICFIVVVRKFVLFQNALTKELYINNYLNSIAKTTRAIDQYITTIHKKRYKNHDSLREACLDFLLGEYEKVLGKNVTYRLSFSIYDYSRKRFRFVSYRGIDDRIKQLAETGLTIENSTAGMSMEHRDPVYIEDTSKVDTTKFRYFPLNGDAKTRSMLCLSAWRNSEAIGVLSVDADKPHGFTEADIEIMQQFIEKIVLIYSLFPIRTGTNHS